MTDMTRDAAALRAQIGSLVAEYQKVTPALIQKTAQEYLRPENRTIVIVQPPAAAQETPETCLGGRTASPVVASHCWSTPPPTVATVRPSSA